MDWRIIFNGCVQKVTMIPNKYTSLEQYLRDLPVHQQEVTISFEQIEHALNYPLPAPAFQDPLWWGNQRKGTFVDSIAWMDAGWMVDTVDLIEKWVKFVRQ